MADDIKAKREKRRLDKEQARQRREHKAKKLVERMLDNEVREIENWNRDRLNMAKKIDDAYKKGKSDSLYMSFHLYYFGTAITAVSNIVIIFLIQASLWSRGFPCTCCSGALHAPWFSQRLQ